MKEIRRKSDIYPLQKIKFEDTEFYAPKNPHEYLKTIFNFYNQIPLNVKIANHPHSKLNEKE
jgi:lipopolysaccharide cholinephosphotransferase